MITLENDSLAVSIDEKGAELKHIFSKRYQLEYMWGADPAYWAKSSPVLFPIVGALKNNEYHYSGRAYTLSRHGFARDRVFKVQEQTANFVRFQLVSDEGTLQVFPFSFEFSIGYTLLQDSIRVIYEVRNAGEGVLLFSVGGHPAFRVPLLEGTSYEDYFLEFEKEERAGRWPISKDGLIEREALPLLEDTRILKLSKSLFSKDALVLKHLRSQAVWLKSDKTDRGLKFSFPGFPYLGLWAAPGADFLCIEPWCGIADHVDADQELEHKEGIISLSPSE